MQTMQRTVAAVAAALALAATAPAAMAEDAYIQSSGTQAINTGYYANPQTRIVADFQLDEIAAQARVFGADVTADAGTIVSCSLYINGGKTYVSYAMKDGVGQWQTMVAPDTTARHQFRLDTNKVYFITGNTTNYNGNLNRANVTRISDRPMAIFANCRSTDFTTVEQFGKLKLYALRIYDGAEPIHYFVPYARDGVTGMRDAITGEVYQDYRGAAFSYGGDMGVYCGYDAADCPPGKLHSDFSVIDGKLVDLSYGHFRDNNGTLEYRVRVKGRLCTASIDGGIAAAVADKWIPFGSSATIALSAQTCTGREFIGWRSDGIKIPATSRTSASISLTVSEPCVICADARSLSEPYSDARFWMRSMGEDGDGDGIVDDGELGDSLRRADVAGIAKCHNSPVFSNELVRKAYAGERGTLQTVYLPQEVTWTNETSTLGYISPSVIQLASKTEFEEYGLTTNAFTIALRFRPDDQQLRSDDSTYMMNFGYDRDQQRGFMLGLGNPTVSTNRYRYGGSDYAQASIYEKEFTKYTLNFNRRNGAASSMANAVWGGCWHDLIISVDGSTVRWMLSREGFDKDDLPENVFAKSISDNAGQSTIRKEFAMGIDGETKIENSAVPAASESWYLGGRVPRTGGWDGTKENGGLDSGAWGAFPSECFRGSFQQIALWNRSMSFDEMGDAIAWPRQDVARLGVEDGSSDEFEDGAVAEQDDWRWRFPQELGAGDSATFKFALDGGLAGMRQRLKWTSASESATGKVRLTVNGSDCGEEQVAASSPTAWTIECSCLVAGTNTVLFTRTDGGSSPVVLDAAVIGGSWQIGDADGDFYDFGHETAATNVNWVSDGNWHDYPRAYFGSVNGSSRHTNAVFRFTVPADVLATPASRFTLRWRTLRSASSTDADHRVGWRLNGTLIYDEVCDGETHKLPIATSALRSENTLELYNGGTYQSGKYFGLDFVSLESPRGSNGTVMVFR